MLNIQACVYASSQCHWESEWSWGRWCWFQTSERSMHAISFKHRCSSAFFLFCGSLTHSLLHLHLIYTNGLLTFCSSKEKHCEAAANGDQQRLLFWDLSSPVWPAILPWSVGAVYPLLLFLSHILLNIPPQFFTIFFLTFFSLDFFLVTEHLSS